jgi:hypothetical protein
MKRSAFVLAWTPAAVLAACGGTVSTIAGGSGPGGATSSASATSSTTSTGGITASASSSSGGVSCASSIDLVVDNGAPEHLTSICAGATWNPTKSSAPIGYVSSSGNPLETLHVLGCASAAAPSEGIEFAVDHIAGPGTYMTGTASYTDPMGAAWTTMGFLMFQVVVTKLDLVGGFIDGTFSAFTGQPNHQQAHPVSGSFHVCHVQDQIGP